MEISLIHIDTGRFSGQSWVGILTVTVGEGSRSLVYVGWGKRLFVDLFWIRFVEP